MRKIVAVFVALFLVVVFAAIAAVSARAGPTAGNEVLLAPVIPTVNLAEERVGSSPRIGLIAYTGAYDHVRTIRPVKEWVSFSGRGRQILKKPMAVVASVSYLNNLELV